jgi:hypothetical protein
MKFPIDFEEKAALPPAPNGTGYPYKLSAKDLMANFRYAAINIDPDQSGPLQLEIIESNGKRRVRLLIELPSSGTHVLGAVSGVLQWIGTEDCDD